MSIRFNCKTSEAYYIKVLAELLTNNLKTGCFEVDTNGIFLRMFDHHRKTLVDLSLDAENFTIFRFKNESKFSLGLNLNHFHKMLKSIKKKDSLELFIEPNNSNELGIKTIPKENTRVTTSGIKIQSIQNLEIDVPSGYRKPVIVPSTEFQKMCKDLNSIGSTNITVIAKNFHIEFIADADGILKRKVSFGENQENYDYESDEDNIEEYKATFATDQLIRITKLAGLGTNMQIFSGTKNLPLLFKSSVGSLGKISIYVKSKELVDQELNSYDSEESSSDEDSD
jgi:proliferating cell nuclear antigen PCNA